MSDIDVAWLGIIADRQPGMYKVVEAAGVAHSKGMQSYLCMMGIRLLEMRRVLKTTGSIYVHCDPTASHYLKLLMDAVFGREAFRNEIVWRRRHGTFSQVHTANKFGVCNDNILFYAVSSNAHFTTQYTFDEPDYEAYLEKAFRHKDPEGRVYRIDNLANPAPRPNLMYEYKGIHTPRTDGLSPERKWSSGTVRGVLSSRRRRPGESSADGSLTK